MKKFLAACFTIMLTLTLILPAYAATTYTEGTLYYTVKDESITITGCFGTDTTVEVPSMIAGIPVNTIGKDAFANNENIKNVILPDTITSIEEGAFASNITVQQRKANSTDPDESPQPSSAPSDDTSAADASGSENPTDTGLITIQTASSETSDNTGAADEADVDLDSETSSKNPGLNDLSTGTSLVIAAIAAIAAIIFILFVVIKRKKNREIS